MNEEPILYAALGESPSYAGGRMSIDTITAIGLWQKTVWGIFCFLTAIASQFLIYTIFIDYFAFTLEQRQTIYGLLGTELILLLIFFLLLVTKK